MSILREEQTTLFSLMANEPRAGRPGGRLRGESHSRKPGGLLNRRLPRKPPTVRQTENAQPRKSSRASSPTRVDDGTARQTPSSESFRVQAAQRPIEDTSAKELLEQRAPPAKPTATAEPASAG